MPDKRFDSTPPRKTVKVREHARMTKHGLVTVDEHVRSNPVSWHSYSTLKWLQKPGYAEAHDKDPAEIAARIAELEKSVIQPKFEDHKMFEGSASKPQRIFHKTVQDWMVEQGRQWKVSEEKFARDYPDEFKPPTQESLEQNKYDMHEMLPYSFHARDQVTVDATLYDILSHGQADYGYGSSLYEKIHKDLEAAGYGMENYGGGRHDFFKQ